LIGNASSRRCPPTPVTNELDSAEWAGLAAVVVAPSLIWLPLLRHRGELTDGEPLARSENPACLISLGRYNANFPLRQSSSGLSQESLSTGHGESCFIGDYFGLAISGMKV
jgi:hypothetical protein